MAEYVELHCHSAFSFREGSVDAAGASTTSAAAWAIEPWR